MKVVIGMDIGGTNSDLALVDKNGFILDRTHLDTSLRKDFNDYADAVGKAASQMLDKGDYQLQAFGVGAPNGNFYSGMIELAPNLPWKGKIHVTEIMKERLGVPCYITNDANAAALGEMIFGVAGNLKNYVMITLGTGVGSGVVVNGELVYGHDGFAGEVGHIISTENGRDCGCGRKGCLETYASVTGLRKTVYNLHKEGHEGMLKDISFEDLTGKDIAEAAEKGDRVSLDAFDLAGKELGKVLASVAAVNSPEAYVLFGGMAKAGKLIFDPIRKYMEQELLPIYRDKIKLLHSGLKGNEAAILGAAALAWNEIERK